MILYLLTQRRGTPGSRGGQHWTGPERPGVTRSHGHWGHSEKFGDDAEGTEGRGREGAKRRSHVRSH